MLLEKKKDFLNSKTFLPRTEKSRVIVAMSGGVDSSTVAAMMKKKGFDVVGITLQLYNQGKFKNKSKTCCAGQDIYDAKKVASILKIPHYVLNYEDIFKKSVIDYFADSYVNGETPIPCALCNQTVKFNDLLEVALKLDAKSLITGHYVRKIEGNDGPELHRAIDINKDQSYFLFGITKDQLEHLDFPLGELSKEETREVGRKLGISIADKPDSQDICFVPNGNYRAVIEKLRPEAYKSGKIIHTDGRVLGEHNGIVNFTIGQRKGLGISLPEPTYVVSLDPKTNCVYVGPIKDTYIKKIKIKNINWLAKVDDGELLVKVRSTGKLLKSYIKIINQTEAEITLKEDESGVSSGQACVFYSNLAKCSRVLGGGWISETSSF